jgi:hypothetical protein
MGSAMATSTIDLTATSVIANPNNENLVNATKSTPQVASSRNPLKQVQNNSQDAAMPLSAEVKLALKPLNKSRLMKELVFLCQNSPAVEGILVERLLVRGKDVDRYHEDSDSENDTEQMKPFKSKSDRAQKAIAVADDVIVPRFAECLNCKEEFDVTNNDQRMCGWHPGTTTLTYI